MSYTKKAKNAERLGLRFSISFLRMKDELVANVRSITSFTKCLGLSKAPSDS